MRTRVIRNPDAKEIMQKLKDTFPVRTAIQTYTTMNSKTSGKDFEQIFFPVDQSERQKHAQFFGRIKSKILSDKLCFSPFALDIWEGTAIKMDYVKSALNGDTESPDRTLVFIMAELRKTTKSKTPNIDSLHFFELEIDTSSEKITFRTHALCKAYRGLMPSTNALFFDADYKILQCLFQGDESKVANLDPQQWTFQAKLEIVDNRIYSYYRSKILENSKENIPFFKDREYKKLSFGLRDETGTECHDEFEQFYNVGLDDKPLVQIWKFATPELKKLMWQDATNNIIVRLFEETTYLTDESFPPALHDFERKLYKKNFMACLEGSCEAVFSGKGGLKTINTTAKNGVKKYLINSLKKIINTKDTKLNDLGNLFLQT